MVISVYFQSGLENSVDPDQLASVKAGFYTVYMGATSRENLSSGVCEQHRRRPACASVQFDQRLCYSLFGTYHM